MKTNEQIERAGKAIEYLKDYILLAQTVKKVKVEKISQEVTKTLNLVTEVIKLEAREL